MRGSPEKAPAPSHLPASILQRLSVALRPLLCATHLEQDACEVGQARRYICALAGTHALPAVRSVTHAALFGRWSAVRQVRHSMQPTPHARRRRAADRNPKPERASLCACMDVRHHLETVNALDIS
jgi:hypothetical protein